MKKLFYPVVFHPEETGYSVYVPDIDGCFSQGETMGEACENATDAIGIFLDQYADENKPIPTPSCPKDITLDAGDFITMIEFDELEYRRRNDSRAVKKTLTIPSWLNLAAERAGVNFSQTLQTALKEQLGLNG